MSPERYTARLISIDLEDRRDIARVMIDGETFAPGVEGEIHVSLREEDGSDVVVTTVDFAGHETEVVFAATQADSGGCNSTAQTSSSVRTSVLASLLLLPRRRRRSTSCAAAVCAVGGADAVVIGKRRGARRGIAGDTLPQCCVACCRDG